MGRFGGFDIRGLKEFQENLNKLQDPDAFVESCAKELAARLYARVKKRTHTGKYSKSTGKQGGTLKRGWTIGEIRKEGDTYVIEIVNPVEYASYVEYGHRTANHKGWVPGQFFMQKSVQEIEKITPKILENEIKKYLKDIAK